MNLNNINPILSLCMIVRDEEKNLSSCLESVKDIVDEMIIIDTGSTDNTIQKVLRGIHSVSGRGLKVNQLFPHDISASVRRVWLHSFLSPHLTHGIF